MKMRVGIPRAMGYYYLYPFFRTLLTELGAEPVLSPPSTARTLERMDMCPTDEPCLPVKLHISHADALANREDISFLFLPVVARVDTSWCCPKFIGVADMTRHGLQLADDRVMMPVLDYSDDEGAMLTPLLPLAERLGIRDRQILARAIHQAREAQQQFRELCITQQLTTPEAYRVLETGTTPLHTTAPADGPTIAVIGHPYILYEVVSQGMIERLRHYGPVVTAEMVDQQAITDAMASIVEGDRLWPFEAMMLGAALHLLRGQHIQKMILVGSFECGPESIIESYIEEEAHRQGIPLMVLAMDEHSGEAGLATRLEAFMDTEKTSGAPPITPETPYVAGSEELVLGFPSMGHLDIAIRTFVESFGVRTVRTPHTTQACIELGREVAPEFACFPFTATLGQMRWMLDRGANTLLMIGGKGYCRLGWYAQVQERLLQSLGYSFQLLTVDAPLPLKTKWPVFNAMMKRITHDASWTRILGGLHLAYVQLAALDRAEQVAHRLRAFERVPGTTDRITDRYVRQLAVTGELQKIRHLARLFEEETAAIETEDTHPLHVRIAGEIWVILEQAVTRDVERWLGARQRPRVWVRREHSASEWFRANVLRWPSALKREHQLEAAAKPWLSQRVGGHGQMTVGQAALARKEGMDGLIHIFPFTCMPEIIAQNIMVRLAEEHDTPILTYIVSEQTGEAGMETRLESFLDVLEERRLARGPSAAGVLLPA
ncbi:MAG TPA: acyl-CoA dehydratase activase-related protein [Armatimonadota bacterium]|jgi:predicted nucleotide-binding protein (sugar kinase/HSP70/actin superfamily)